MSNFSQNNQPYRAEKRIRDTYQRLRVILRSDASVIIEGTIIDISRSGFSMLLALNSPVSLLSKRQQISFYMELNFTDMVKGLGTVARKEERENNYIFLAIKIDSMDKKNQLLFESFLKKI